MTTGGMAADMNSVGIASKTRSIFIDPYDAALNLIGHGDEVAAGFDNVIEVEHDEMCAGARHYAMLVFLPSLRDLIHAKANIAEIRDMAQSNEVNDRNHLR